MPRPELVALAHYRQQTSLARRITAEIMRLWRTLNPRTLDVSWAGASDRTLALLAGGQFLSASAADGYLDHVLDAQSIDPASEGRVNVRALVGVASDGRPLASLLNQPLITVKTAISRGASPTQALAVGGMHLNMIARTQLADAGRVADGVAMMARPRATMYVRMLSPPSCARCVILAGRLYRARDAFQRHPSCDCRHIPTEENVAGDLRTNPYRYLENVDRAEAERILGKAGARAVLDDDADINQVVNARRGMSTTRLFGQQVQITSEGTTRRGLAGHRLGARNADAVEGITQSGIRRTVHRAKSPRLMPESIYAQAERLKLSREETISFLKRHGYIL